MMKRLLPILLLLFGFACTPLPALALDPSEQFIVERTSGAGTLAMTLRAMDPSESRRLVALRIKVLVAPTTTENLTVKIDSGWEASDEPIVLAKSMVGVTDYEYRWDPGLPVPEGDAVVISWANTDTRTWYLEAFYEK